MIRTGSMHEPAVFKSLSNWSQEEDIPRVGLTFSCGSPVSLPYLASTVTSLSVVSPNHFVAPPKFNSSPLKMMAEPFLSGPFVTFQWRAMENHLVTSGTELALLRPRPRERLQRAHEAILAEWRRRERLRLEARLLEVTRQKRRWTQWEGGRGWSSLRSGELSYVRMSK